MRVVETPFGPITEAVNLRRHISPGHSQPEQVWKERTMHSCSDDSTGNVLRVSIC